MTTALPTAADILEADPPPIALTETLYDRAGQVREERTYDTSCAAAFGGSGCADPDYVSVRTDYDGRGLVVEQQTPGGPTTTTLYDAKGRPKTVKTLVGSAEIQRVEKSYSPRDNLLREITYERKANASGDGLYDGNAIVRYRYYWYDASNRLKSTADYGTASADGTFTNGPEPDYGANPPSQGADGVLVTHYGYDEAGRQNTVTDPAGIVTRTEFDDTGRPVLVTENYGGAGEPRHTAYQYAKTTGVLEKVAAVRALGSGGGVDWAATDGTVQVTRYAYDALVESSSNGLYEHVTTNGAWISAVYYPDPETGQPEAEPSVQFTYRFDGQPARRIDGRGVELLYGYDDRDRLGSITVASAPATGLLAVDQFVDRMSYAHTSDGLLAAARTHGDATLRSEAAFDYGRFRQLTSASQSLPDYGADKSVAYAWDVDTAANRFRLTGMTYPSDVGVSLDFDYGAAAGDLDDALSRLTDLSIDGSSVASWRYMGLGRQVGMTLGNGLELTYEGQSGGAAEMMFLDSFGRVLAMPYGGGLLQYQYGYDKRGNRTFRRATSTSPQPLGDELEDSWLYEYDDLSRLVRASRGKLNASGDGFELGEVTPESTTWSLDELGNWSAGSDGVSVTTYVDTDGDGHFDSSEGDAVLATEHHETNQTNEIESRVTGDDAGTNGPEPFAYDDAGNLVFDGMHYFIYDAFNRVVWIHKKGDLEVVNGELVGTPGDAVARYGYDGLGRRVLSLDCIGVEGCDLTYELAAKRTTRHVYGGGPETLAEYDVDYTGTETLQRWFVHGQSFPDPLVMVDPGSSKLILVASTIAEHCAGRKQIVSAFVLRADTKK